MPDAMPASAAGIETAPHLSSLLRIALVAWLLSLGVDLFLHAGLLARLYVAPSPFLLDAGAAFRRIPAGYLTFLVLTGALAWLMRRLGLEGAGGGFRFGLAAGGVVWGALGRIGRREVHRMVKVRSTGTDSQNRSRPPSRPPEPAPVCGRLGGRHR